MSVSKWAYEPEKCDGQPCVGECDLCARHHLYEVREFFANIGLRDSTGLLDVLFTKESDDDE